MEIERKFWIPKSDIIFEYKKLSVIKQYYINKPTDFYEIRLREYVYEDRYYLEFKSKGDLIREEFGTSLTKEQFYKILDGTESVKYVIKYRYYLEGNVFYDEYQEKLKGLNTLEVEGTEDYVKNFKLPFPFNEGLEVTYHSDFKNRNLSLTTYESMKENLNEFLHTSK